MDSKQILDSLTAHIALYHSSSHRSSPRNPSPSYPRTTILRWFSSLSVPQRQSSLTVLDSDFVKLLLQMQSRLRNDGHGFFFLLPDLPSPSTPSLPGTCFRRSRGLLRRASASNDSERSISRSLLLFGSREGEQISDCLLDSVTVSDDFVSNVDRFVEVMDGVSCGEFLRGEVNRLGITAWEELSWLKDKGYYSAEAFVANKLEIALRLSWLNCHGGKKQKGGKSKEKTASAGVAANVFWRKKGCLDWWASMDPGLRKKTFLAFLGKAANLLANEIVKEPNIVLKDEFCEFIAGEELPLRYGHTASSQRVKQSFSGSHPDFCLHIVPAPSSLRHHILASLLNRGLVVQEICAMFSACQHSELEKDKLFFTKLGSAHTVSDCILRKLRGFLMVVSIDCTKLELMGAAKLKTLPNKTEEKFGVGCRRGKSKCHYSKRLNSMPTPSRVISTPACSVDLGCETACVDDSNSRLCPQQNTLYVVADLKTSTEHEVNSFICKGPIIKKKSRKKGAKSKSSSLQEPVNVGNPELEMNKSASLSVAVQSVVAESVGSTSTLSSHPMPNGLAISGKLSPNSSFYSVSNELDTEDGTEMSKSTQLDLFVPLTPDSCVTGTDFCSCSNKSEDDDMYMHVGRCHTEGEGIPQATSSGAFVVDSSPSCDKLIGNSKDIPIRGSTGNEPGSETMNPAMPLSEQKSVVVDKEHDYQTSRCISGVLPQSVAPKMFQTFVNDRSVVVRDGSNECSAHNHINHSNSIGGTSYEWPSIAPLRVPSVNSQHLPAATDRLHLDVGCNWANRFHHSFLPARHQARDASTEGGSRILPSLTLPMSLDWPPMVKSWSRLSQTVTLSYDPGYTPMLQSSFCSGFTAHGMHANGTCSENDRKHSWGILDAFDLKNASELTDDTESHWMSEEEPDIHAFSGRDYNQYFGGGVMYWNTAEHVGAGFSRPPSHSSEDSSWAWHEADLNRAIDDMVGIPSLSASYNSSGLASPPAATFCSPFDPLGSGHLSVGYAMSGNDINGKLLNSSASVSDVPEEKICRSLNGSPSGVEGDPPPYPMLRPIIVPRISRKGSRSEFKLGHDHKSPCIPSTGRDAPRIKRPPSPVVLCVPRVPRPPPPSPVGGSRKRGFPIVRSGSSSPRHWGMRNWYHEESNSEENQLCLDGAEVVWPSWGNEGLAATPMMQSIPGSLLQDHLITISQITCDQEHPDVALPLQPPDILDCPSGKASLSMMHSLLHEEIDCFCKQVEAENLIKKPYINWAVKRVGRSLQVLWPRSRTNIFGSNATGLALPTSDVDLVVSLPPVRNLEPIKEAGILEGRNGIKETCLQHAARYLANQEWVRNDSLKTIENTAIPVIMLVAEVPHDVTFPNGNSSILDSQNVKSTRMPHENGSISHSHLFSSENGSWPICSKMRRDGAIDVKSIRLDISFKSPSHRGLQTTELVRELSEQFPASVPLAFVLKQFLADRSLDHSYSGGLSSYCLVLLITRFLQHEHHVGRPNQNLGSLLMDFLYFFGNVFDPRQMRISIQGSGVYMNRERGLSIDPLHIDDPLSPTNNIGRNCFRIHQCIKAFADAYSVLEKELAHFSSNCDPSSRASSRLLPKIIPSIDQEGYEVELMIGPTSFSLGYLFSLCKSHGQEHCGFLWVSIWIGGGTDLA